MTTDVDIARTLTVDDRLDWLCAQVEEIAADLARQRQAREQWQELAQTLAPVSRGAFDLASRELEDLGESLVLLLGVAKKLAQPDVIGLLDRTVDTLREGQATHLDPSSTFALFKQLRDPHVRRGLARALQILQTIGTEPTSKESDQHQRKV